MLTASGVLAASPLLHAGYLGVALLVCIEGFGIPAPGQTAVVVAAGYAGTGHLNVFGVAAVALIATIAGDNIGYYLGHHAGRRLILRYGRYVRLTEARLDRVEAFMLRRGPIMVTFSRFVDGLRQLSGLVCGTTGLPWRRFVWFDALGAVFWVGVWTTVGYFAGNHLHTLHQAVRRNEWWAVGLVIVAAAGFFAYRRYRHRDDVHIPE